MVRRKITTLEGHPDASERRLNHALADEYRRSAREAGHEIRELTVATMDVPTITKAVEFYDEAPPPQIVLAQEELAWANHIVVFYPMWLGGMPAKFRAFIEQTFRPGFHPRASAHFFVTMDAPTAVHRLYLRTFLKHLHRNVLQFSDVAPITETIFGGVGSAAAVTIEKWFARMREYGKAAR